MNCVEEITYLVQEEGLELFKYLEDTFWTPWCLQQPGIVNKQMWIQPGSNPCLVNIVVTWYGTDFVEIIDKTEIEQIKQTIMEAMASADFIYQEISSNQWLSMTIIDQGKLDQDNDQDDNDNIAGDDTSGLNPDGSVIPDDDSDENIQIMNGMSSMPMDEMKTFLKDMGIPEEEMEMMSEEDMNQMVDKMQQLMKST
jgi:hypothetical protein